MTDPCARGCAQCGTQFARAANQPFGVEIFSADNVFVKQMVIPDAGTYVPQHSHKYDHMTMLARGSVKAWADGEFLGEYQAPRGIEIKAGVKHTFMALEDNTIMYCIHNAARPDVAAVESENRLVQEDA